MNQPGNVQDILSSLEFLTSVSLKLKDVEETLLRENHDRHLCLFAPRIKVVCPPAINYNGLILANTQPFVIPTGEIVLEVKTEAQAEYLFNRTGVADSNDMWKDFHAYSPDEALFFAIAPPDVGMGSNWKSYGTVPRETLRMMDVTMTNTGFIISK